MHSYGGKVATLRAFVQLPPPTVVTLRHFGGINFGDADYTEGHSVLRLFLIQIHLGQCRITHHFKCCNSLRISHFDSARSNSQLPAADVAAAQTILEGIIIDETMQSTHS